MNESTLRMLQALTKSGNQDIAEKAKKLLSGEIDPEEEKQYAGSFLLAVLNGDFLQAYGRADYLNQAALRSIFEQR